MVKYKLYYFDDRARGEPIRLLFAAAGKKFEDVRIQRELWKNFKPDAPLGKVPYLEVNLSEKKIITLLY
jgi:glutathione S-transferase